MSASGATNAAPDAHGFPVTAWTVMLAARDFAAPDAVAALNEICSAYRRPILSYLQSLGLKGDEAEDVTQTVLAGLCHNHGLASVDRAKGRLRYFLKATARNALINFRRDAATLKRGGGATDVPLDELPAADTPADEAPPDAVFDRQWAWTIFDRAMRTLEAGYAQRGKAALLESLKPALISGDAVQHSAALGSQFGVTEPQIRIELHRLRRRFAERLHAEVAATLDPASPPAEIAAETRYLVQILAHERKS